MNGFKMGLLTAFMFAGFSAQATVPRVGDLVYGYSTEQNHLVGNVINIYGTQAEVNWVRRNGADYTGSRTYWPLSHLSLESRCADAICQGGTIYAHQTVEDTFYVGTVIHTFENGMVELNWNSNDGLPRHYNRNNYWNASQLSHEVSCAGTTCAAQQVYMSMSHGDSTSEYVGTISRVFTGGNIARTTEGQGVAEIRYDRINGRYAHSRRALAYWHTSHLHERTAGDGSK